MSSFKEEEFHALFDNSQIQNPLLCEQMRALFPGIEKDPSKTIEIEKIYTKIYKNIIDCLRLRNLVS